MAAWACWVGLLRCVRLSPIETSKRKFGVAQYFAYQNHAPTNDPYREPILGPRPVRTQKSVVQERRRKNNLRPLNSWLRRGPFSFGARRTSPQARRRLDLRADAASPRPAARALLRRASALPHGRRRCRWRGVDPEGSFNSGRGHLQLRPWAPRTSSAPPPQSAGTGRLGLGLARAEWCPSVVLPLCQREARSTDPCTEEEERGRRRRG